MSAQAPIRPQDPPTGTQPAPPAPPQPPRGPAGAGGITIGVVLIVLGTIWLLEALGVAVPLGTIVPILLIALGLGVAISAVLGEDSGLTGVAVFLGVVLAIGALLFTVLDTPVRGGMGERNHAPTTATELEDSYGVLAGTVTVDLADLVLAPGTTELAVTTVLGEVEVVVPAGMAVDVDATVAGGTIDLLGTTTDGLGLSDGYTSEGYDQADSRLRLELRAGLGEVRLTTP